MFSACMECPQHSITKTSIVNVCDIDDCLLLGEEGVELPELEARERDLLDHLDAGLQDLVQRQTWEISVEADVSLLNGVYESV